MQTRDKDGHALCPMCGGVAKLVREISDGELSAWPECTICGTRLRVKTVVVPGFNAEAWVRLANDERKELLDRAWLGWDSAWWTKARKPVVEPLLLQAKALDQETIDALKSLGLVKAEELFTTQKTESGGWWRVDDEGTIHESREVALEAVWEGCEGHAPDHVGLTEYEFDHKRGELVRTGNVLVVDFAKWLEDRGVTDEPEVNAS